MRYQGSVRKHNRSVGKVVRIRCEYRVFQPLLPDDLTQSRQGFGTAFLLRLLDAPPCWVTAYHCVQDAVRITMMLDGVAREMTVEGRNPHLDVAVLQFRAPPHTDKSDVAAAFVPSPCPSVRGQRVMAIGYAGATLFRHTTVGVVSGRTNYPHNRVQTTTAINPGNSGGPVVDEATGELMGMVTSGMDDMQNTNFFLDVIELMLTVTRLLRGTTTVDWGYHLDAVLHPVQAGVAGPLGGALVSDSLHPELSPGDVIVAIDGHVVDEHMRIRPEWWDDGVDFRNVLDRMDAPECTLAVQTSNGTRKRVRLQLGKSQRGTQHLLPDCEPVEFVRLGGLTLQRLSQSHHTPDKTTHTFPSLLYPERYLHSCLVITHVAAGSAFSAHELNTPLVGREVVRIRFLPDGMWQPAPASLQAWHGRNIAALALDHGGYIGAPKKDVDQTAELKQVSFAG